MVGPDHITRLLPEPHIDAMLKAVREVPEGIFKIEEDREDAGTVVVTHIPSGRCVLKAILKGVGEPWIVTNHRKLFTARR